MYFHSPTRADLNSLQPKCRRGYQLSAIETGTSGRESPVSNGTRLSPLSDLSSGGSVVPARAAIVGAMSMCAPVR